MFKIFIAFVFIFNLSGRGYNNVQAYDEQVNASWLEVSNQHQHRIDPILNLVVDIKGYSSHEQEILEAATSVRSQANRVSSNLQKAPGDEQKLQAWQQAQTQVTHALGQLTIISERYPQLKAQGLYQNLTVRLEESESRVAAVRERYIKATERYNVTIRKFPAVLTTRVTDYTSKKNYSPGDVTVVSKAPTIDFS